MYILSIWYGPTKTITKLKFLLVWMLPHELVLGVFFAGKVKNKKQTEGAREQHLQFFGIQKAKKIEENENEKFYLFLMKMEN